jgi:predicted RNase H-like HicB family nuclease
VREKFGTIEMTPKFYKVDAFWDRDARVWVAESEDVPGLATEADTIESLTDKLKQMIPELLSLNHLLPSDYMGEITFELISHRQELIQIAN